MSSALASVLSVAVAAAGAAGAAFFSSAPPPALRPLRRRFGDAAPTRTGDTSRAVMPGALPRTPRLPLPAAVSPAFSAVALSSAACAATISRSIGSAARSSSSRARSHRRSEPGSSTMAVPPGSSRNPTATSSAEPPFKRPRRCWKLGLSRLMRRKRSGLADSSPAPAPPDARSALSRYFTNVVVANSQRDPAGSECSTPTRCDPVLLYWLSSAAIRASFDAPRARAARSSSGVRSTTPSPSTSSPASAPAAASASLLRPMASVAAANVRRGTATRSARKPSAALMAPTSAASGVSSSGTACASNSARRACSDASTGAGNARQSVHASPWRVYVWNTGSSWKPNDCSSSGPPRHESRLS